ncbi:MAG TPA: hypothetical protein VL443_20545 [Cyclobacteriaceae bacterium]|nr:hypothetical protein [Cyclobacteriaceae bacterium]
MNLIKRITFPCGIVLRFERSYYDKVERWGDERLLNEFKDFTEKRRFIERNSPEDIITFCQIHGLSDYSLLQEIKTKTSSFTIAMQSVKKFKAYKPPSQLSLFTENLVR